MFVRLFNSGGSFALLPLLFCQNNFFFYAFALLILVFAKFR